MKRITLSILFGLLLILFTTAQGLEAAQIQKETKRTVPMPTTVAPRKAQPAEKPAATGQRDKVSATGFFDKEQDEPTQERPNPLDAKAARGIDPGQNPVTNPGSRTPR
ncbi:MAG: hypothetical protein RBT20_05475 [Syntrophales bacterium]|jgi:hypothetical protein|nr:hypothetical protein [Syntrophales bacterium]